MRLWWSFLALTNLLLGFAFQWMLWDSTGDGSAPLAVQIPVNIAIGIGYVVLMVLCYHQAVESE